MKRKNVSLLILLLSLTGIVLAQDPIENIQDKPEFIGGYLKLIQTIQDNIIYTYDAYKAKIGGKVFVRFVIDTTGQVTNVSIANGIRDDVNNEAIRVVSQLPNWVPGKNNGKNVKVWFILPVNFDPNSKCRVEPKPKKAKDTKSK